MSVPDFMGERRGLVLVSTQREPIFQYYLGEDDEEDWLAAGPGDYGSGSVFSCTPCTSIRVRAHARRRGRARASSELVEWTDSVPCVGRDR